MEMEHVRTYIGRSPINGERWMRREIGRDEKGTLYYRDSSLNWKDQEWTPLPKGKKGEWWGAKLID